MYFTPPSVLILAVVSAVIAAPSPISPRQVEWHAVGELYSDGGCTSQTFIFGDPIFGAANTCHPLDRNDNVPPIVSYKTVSVDAGCTVILFYDSNCSDPANGFTAGVNGCVQGDRPFESAIVKCPT